MFYLFEETITFQFLTFFFFLAGLGFFTDYTLSLSRVFDIPALGCPLSISFCPPYKALLSDTSWFLGLKSAVGLHGPD